MEYVTEKKRVPGLLGIILIAGLFGTSIAIDLWSRDAIVHGISARDLPLTGNNIHFELQKDIFSTVFISSLMAEADFIDRMRL